MSTLHTRPDGRDVDVVGERTVLAALVAAGVPITHACGGRARCSTCRVRVESGAESLAPRSEAEAAMAARLRFDAATRLACQARVLGDVTVRRLVLDDHDEILATCREGDTHPAAVGREERVSLLFADVADFTPLSSRLPPYDVIHLLNRWFLHAGRAVETAGGRIDNYMGDGLLAVFRGDGHEHAAVRAGLGLLEAADGVSAYARTLYGSGFGVRVGIHAGTVVIGDLGAAHNRRESVIGDAVNVASRIEAANKPLGTRLLVSGPVLAAVRGTVRTGRSVDVALKGKEGTHRVTEVLA